MTVVKEDNSLLAACEKTTFWRQGANRPWLDELCAFARASFHRLGFPTTRNEAWRFTNVAPLTRIKFQPARDEPQCLSPGVIADACPGLSVGHQLVFVNGHFDGRSSSFPSISADVVLSALSTVGGAALEWIENALGKYADSRQHVFTALNTACLQDAAVLFLSQGAVIEQPIHLLFVSSAAAAPTVSHPRILIVADAGSRATIQESYVGLAGPGAGAAPCFTNSVTEIVVNDKAAIEYCRLQDEHSAAFHIGTTQVQVGTGARFHSHVVSSGAKLARHELNVELCGEGGECSLNGLACARGRQLMDHQTHIEHVKPHCTSRELYKAVLEDHAHGVFRGKIHVHAGAQKTDARQANHTLLLSDDAVMDTQPHLEIYADDVKCTHGASVGSVDEQAMFYMRSRGIGCDDALRLLKFAFMNEILQHVPADAIRGHLERHLAGITQVDRDQP